MEIKIKIRNCYSNSKPNWSYEKFAVFKIKVIWFFIIYQVVKVFAYDKTGITHIFILANKDGERQLQWLINAF